MASQASSLCCSGQIIRCSEFSKDGWSELDSRKADERSCLAVLKRRYRQLCLPIVRYWEANLRIQLSQTGYQQAFRFTIFPWFDGQLSALQQSFRFNTLMVGSGSIVRSRISRKLPFEVLLCANGW
ncbi:MAG TPA: hypothetical protein VFW59_10165 [Gallionella sp.]|nr:hypothetical protein [Gallionella sp.]